MTKTIDMTFSHRDLLLAGTLHLPEGAVPFPAMIIVPGSGDSDRNADDFFPPIRAAFLDHGIAVLSWDKPGNGESSGDWRLQTIADRAHESLAAIAWLRDQSAIDPDRIGFWGQSQGGWIGPMVAAYDPRLWLLVIHSGTGVTVEEQDHVGLEYTMLRAGATGAEIAQGHEFMDEFHQAAKAGIDHQAFEQAIQAPARGKPWFDYFGEIGVEEWKFFLLNFAPDTIFDPETFLVQVHCPTLAIFGEKDVLIPVQRSIEILNRTVANSSPDLVTRVFPNATHRLGNDDGTPGFTPGYFEFFNDWLSSRYA